MAQFITCCISSDHGILDGHEEDVDPLMLLIQDIMDILYGIRNENRHSLLTVLRKNLLPEWLQGWQVLRRPLALLSPIFLGKLVGHHFWEISLQLLNSVLEMFFCFDLSFSKSSYYCNICLLYCVYYSHFIKMLIVCKLQPLLERLTKVL